MSAVNLSEIAAHVLAHLQLYHVGRENAEKREVLLAQMREEMSDPLLTDRQMRKSIERCCPQVCACDKGYFLPMTDAEVGRAVTYIDRKIHGLYARRRAILEAHPKVGPRQLELR